VTWGKVRKHTRRHNASTGTNDRASNEIQRRLTQRRAKVKT
jgi:hypothetical protein